MNIEQIVTAWALNQQSWQLKKWLPPTLEITSKMHKLQAKIIPDCLFKCIFLIILKLSLHFKIISMPIYSEPQVKAPDHNTIAANTVINFLHLDGARTYFFCAKTWKYAQMEQCHSLAWTLNIDLPAFFMYQLNSIQKKWILIKGPTSKSYVENIYERIEKELETGDEQENIILWYRLPWASLQ